MAQLGSSVGFIGKVGPITTGDFFVPGAGQPRHRADDLRGKERSGKCTLISADGERTMVTYPVQRLELSAEEIETVDLRGLRLSLRRRLPVQNHDLILKAACTAVRPEGR